MNSTEPPQAPGGRQTSTVQVRGHCAIDTRVHGARYSAAAYAVVPKVPGGLWYTVTGSGFNDPAYYGQRLSLTFSAASAVPWRDGGHPDHHAAGTSQDRVLDRGDSLWLCLSSISGPVVNLAEATPYFDARFGGMAVQAVVSVHKAPS